MRASAERRARRAHNRCRIELGRVYPSRSASTVIAEHARHPTHRSTLTRLPGTGTTASSLGQVVGPDRSAKPARMKAADNSVANFDPRNSVADCCLAGAIGERHHTELRRTATAAFQDYQIAVVKRARTRIRISLGPGRGSSHDRNTMPLTLPKRSTR